MYLRQLDVHGFKAFADRQRFRFGPGMTVIMGPNGAGKSNVADAIRWALGEQSSRQIRARKTEDVIFSGSDIRRQMGSAEVTLTLDNSDGWMPIDFREVTVTRRAFRSGDSEYLINGTRVRLTDVLDLFRRAQVGQNSYAMMSQGLVDEVLALPPRERRELIEEAADVRHHRQQLTLSERRLTETRDNLGRVRMLIREVTPRLRQLERQSQKAERYREINGALQDALCVYYEQELRQANDTLAAARAQHDQRARAFATAGSELDALEQRQAALASSGSERREALEALQRRERALAEEALRLEQAVALAEQRLELLQKRRDDVRAQLGSAAIAGQARDRETPDDGVVGSIEAGDDPEAGEGDPIAALELRAASARTDLEREREALRSADDAARAVLRELAGAEARRARLDAELTDAERRAEEDVQRRQRYAEERDQAEQRRIAILDALREMGAHFLQVQRQAADLDRAAEEARDRRSNAEGALEDRLREMVAARDGVRSAEALTSLHAERHSMLERMVDETPEGGGAQALLDAARGSGNGSGNGSGPQEPLTGIVGAISQLLRVPEGLEAAIEGALAEQLGALVVESEEDAAAAIEYLRERRAGTATLFPLDGMAHNYPLNLFNERGVVGVAARLVRTDQRYRPLVDSLLGRTVIVDDLETARRMVKRGLGSVVTRDGILLRPSGAYYGGRSGAAAERFSWRRELEQAPQQTAQAEAEEEAERSRLTEAERAVTEARDGVDRSRHGVDQADELRRTHQHQITRLRRDQAALNSEMRQVRDALSASAAPEAEAAGAASPAAEARRALAEVAAAIAALRDRSQAVGDERDAVSQRATAAAEALAAADGVLRAESEQAAQRRDALIRERERLATLRVQAGEMQREAEDLELSLRDLRERTANNRSALSEAQSAIGPAHAALAEATSEERELAASRGDLQAALLATERATLEIDAALRQSAQQAQTLMQQLAEEGLVLGDGGEVRVLDTAKTAETTDSADDTADGTAEEAVADATGGGSASAPELEPARPAVRGGAEVDPETLRARIAELRASIRGLGPVNVEAMEDLSEERERHDYLSSQVNDLEQAEQELRAAIEELRTQIRTRFDETFALVNTAFGEYFARFFGGGNAEMKLLDGAEGEDPGVEITARPPGKRIASLNALSGGERALTSVALLFALLSVNPAPVCVLDEVDAAMDEANVGRFVEVLREHCERSQFIVISHNRRTVEGADAIYGVSMAEDSTSQVLSLRLADLPAAS